SRILKILFCVSAVFLLAIAAGMSVSAADMGYETLPLSQEDIDRIWDITALSVEPVPSSADDLGDSIVSFDVSESGNILLGLSGDKIVVIDANGNALHYYKFHEDGSYYVLWKEDNILLYLVRSRLIIEISPDGNLVDMVHTDDRSSINDELWRRIGNKNKITVGEYTYAMTNYAFGYSRLIKTDGQGNIDIIYDVVVEQSLRVAAVTIIGIFALAVSVGAIFENLKENQKKQ
ncbi:MAG: hypothetical protein J6L81_09650, partial [Clostridia bacterium]|nr:hypothetical protein [Clostridia bacterium]